MIQLWTYAATANEQWTPVPIGNGSYELVASNSGKCLDITNKSTSNGVQLQQWDCSGASNQSFHLVAQS